MYVQLQGMNAGFEDCTILSRLFSKHGSDLEKILNEYSETRWEDAHAVCDLAMYNYIEMRDLVNKKCKHI
jgi:kynurenine 3-monooxygenase